MSDAANLTIFIAVLIGLAMAAIPATIAERKGRSFGLWFAYGFFFLVIAVVHAALISPNEDAPGMKKCDDCGGIITAEARACAHCGTRFDGESARRGGVVERPGAGDRNTATALASSEGDWSGVIFNGDRSLSNPRYQTYLVKKYAIEKNDTLGKFIVDLDPFDDLAGALAFAHGVESVNTRRLQAMAPVNLELAPEGRTALRGDQDSESGLNELDQAAIQKLRSCNYKLVGIESKGGTQVFKLRSTTSGSDFELEGSVKLREFAAQF